MSSFLPNLDFPLSRLQFVNDIFLFLDSFASSVVSIKYLLIFFAIHWVSINFSKTTFIGLKLNPPPPLPSPYPLNVCFVCQPFDTSYYLFKHVPNLSRFGSHSSTRFMPTCPLGRLPTLFWWQDHSHQKSIWSSLSIFPMSVQLIPLVICLSIQPLMSHFMWGKSNSFKRFP